MADRRVIIAEDGKKFRELLVEVVGAFPGLKVDSVMDGEMLVRNVARGEYDLVLTDNHMPRMSGLEACREIRRTNRSLPIYLLSAERISPETIRAVNATGYLEKGFDMVDDVRSVVQKHFGQGLS